MVIVPIRAAAVVFSATVKVTVPFPLRVESLVTVIHAALLTAIHVQPDVVATFTGPPLPPELSIV